MRLRGSVAFDRTKSRAEYIGSKGYRWRSAGDSDVCDICAKNNGKFFKWNAPPPCGPPGTHSLCPDGHCRCYAEPDIPN
ncbi:phage minor head protein [Xanthobacter sp. ZOL 2024]